MNATTCEIILSRCIYIHNHNWKSKKGHYIWQRNPTRHVSTPVCSMHSFLRTFSRAYVCISLHACVFLAVLRLSISSYWRMIMDPHSFPVDSGKVVTHGNCWVTLPPAARTDKLTNHEGMQTFTISYLSLGGCVIIPKPIMHVGLLHSKTQLAPYALANIKPYTVIIHPLYNMCRKKQTQTISQLSFGWI